MHKIYFSHSREAWCRSTCARFHLATSGFSSPHPAPNIAPPGREKAESRPTGFYLPQPRKDIHQLHSLTFNCLQAVWTPVLPSDSGRRGGPGTEAPLKCLSYRVCVEGDRKGPKDKKQHRDRWPLLFPS